jgi:hypothetical protein
MRAPKSSEIAIAIIGLIGTLGSAIISNFDTLTGQAVKSKTSYHSTSDFQTEYIHLINVSGAKKQFEAIFPQMLNNIAAQEKSQNPEASQQIDQRNYVLQNKAINNIDDFLIKLLPVYEKYFTLEDLQTLNKFYSTEIMQKMMEKQPFLTKEIMPIAVEWGKSLDNQ